MNFYTSMSEPLHDMTDGPGAWSIMDHGRFMKLLKTELLRHSSISGSCVKVWEFEFEL
jgi:hypothetical protein